MGNQNKISTFFGVVVIACLAVSILLIDHYDVSRISEQKDAISSMANLVRIKNNRIIILSRKLEKQQQEYDALQKTLMGTKKDIQSLSQKLPGDGLSH